MQHDPRHVRHLIDDAGEQLPAHVGRRFQILERAWTGLAQQVAAIGHFQVQADRRCFGNVVPLRGNRFKVAARVVQGCCGHQVNPFDRLRLVGEAAQAGNASTMAGT